MKKILLLILMLIPLSIKAEIFYSDYYPWELDSENIYEENELLKKEIFPKYNNYSYQEIDIGYYPKDEKPDYLTNVDFNNYIIEDEYNDLNQASDSIYTNSFLTDNMKTNQIIFTNCSVYSGVIINYINLYINDELIITKEIGENLMYKLPINFKLDNYYLLKDIKIKVRVTDQSKNLLRMTMKVYDENNNYNVYSTRLKNEKETDDLEINFINNKEFNLIKAKLNNDLITDNSLYYYHLEKILYKHYNLAKEKINVYTQESLAGYELDLDDYKNYYNYYQRYYLNVKDEITSPLDVVIGTNAPDLNISYFLNDNHTYTFIFTFLDNKFYKKYELNNEVEVKNNYIIKNNKVSISQPINPKQKEIITSKITTKNLKKENDNHQLIGIKILLLVSTIYIFIVGCKKLLSKRFK